MCVWGGVCVTARFYGYVIAKRIACWASNTIKKDEMGRACSAYGEGERLVQGFGGETWETLV